MSRKVIIVRHGERVDFTFSDEWVRQCFDSDGNYTRQNLNQPQSVPNRHGSPKTFIMDTPLTEIGRLQSSLIGSGLQSEKLLSEGFEVYVSPSLRCIETATNILKGLGVEKELKIEPCLFEWTQWYIGRIPHWMTVEELKKAGFNIDGSYKSMLPIAELIGGESVEDYYKRSHDLMLHLLKQTDKDLLLVAHGSSLETHSRQLLGYQIRNEQEMIGVLRGIPYCGVAVMEYDQNKQKWSLAYAPKLHICHASEHEFDAQRVFCESSISQASECFRNSPATPNAIMHS